MDDLNHGSLQGASLLVLPYGSSVPVAAWPAIYAYLQHGGNLLVIGGQPLQVPVDGHAGAFRAEVSQQTYSRVLGFENTYVLPAFQAARFEWRDGYDFLPKLTVRAQAFYAVEGRLNGLGYMVDAAGDRAAAPVIVSDHLRGPLRGARIVALDFDPVPGYWDSADGKALVGAAAAYARAGATSFGIEAQYAALRPGETPNLTLHLRRPAAAALQASARVTLLQGDRQIDAATVVLAGAATRGAADAAIPFNKPLPAGFYTVQATLSFGGKIREFYANGFRVEQLSDLERGPALGVNGDFLTRGGAPWFPVGTNYFSTESDGWDFSGPRNALVWERDFAAMERHGVTFVRTGVWMPNVSFIDPSGGVNKRFLRNVEGFLAAAQDHNIAVNFTFYGMIPKVGPQPTKDWQLPQNGHGPVQPNPYLDANMIRAEHEYVLSVVRPFARVPFLSYDLINEPSFSNPRMIFHGNVPNGDPAELAAWHEWLKSHYGRIGKLAEAWRVPADTLRSFDLVPLPAEKDMHYSRYGNPDEVRALDYNLFAQAMFSRWVHGMVEAIRSTGSTQLIDVGQDEGGVTDRLLNQFYATSGVSFTTNHTYWQDDALLWDSVAAKRPGVPQITGETGYQPVWSADGGWRYDELTGMGLEERKWVLGFAAGASGALQWDWDREGDFGIERSDGSAKLWENLMRDLGQFAKEAQPYATAWIRPQVAVVLPQPLQLSVYNAMALEAQQTAIRVLYNWDHTPAYAIGSYQMDTLGDPKLIILPSAYGLTDHAWETLEQHVRNGAVLLISGPFDENPHLHATNRAQKIGLGYATVPLEIRNQTFQWAGNPLPLVYGGMKTTTLYRAQMPGGKEWTELTVGKGKILFSALPLELNDRLDSVAAVYRYAIKTAGVTPEYTTTVTDPGLLICPTLLPNATLYALTSETNNTAVEFRDQRSGKSFTGTLHPGRASLLMVGNDGRLIAQYHWRGSGN
ncbi:MAG: beta-galactosidase [Acidobacteriota bacterium]